MYNPELHFYFVGIGGIGMSGIASVLLAQGFRVSGSDLSGNQACQDLVGLGAVIYNKHEATNVPAKAAAVVYSSAIPEANPELVRARELKIPVVPRAAVLAELMRLKHGVAVAGTHGKTSTASMVAAVMEAGKLDPTVIIGGIVHNYAAAGKNGASDYLVAEADESDKSFLLLKPTIAVVTNIDQDHMDCYDSMDQVEAAFGQFINSVPFYGLAVLCVDDERLQSLAKQLDKRIVTYAINQPAKIQAKFLSIDQRSTTFSVFNEGRLLGEVRLAMIGQHYMQNALAAIAVGLEFGISFSQISSALQNFQGVGRRTEVIETTGKHVLINDYGHHPTEIAATIGAVKAAYAGTGKKLTVLFQPHRFSRTQDCWQRFFGCFAEADRALLIDIYPAGEAQIEGVNSRALANEICKSDAGSPVRYTGSLAQTLDFLRSDHNPEGEVILTLGAGSIGRFAVGELADWVSA